MDCRLARRKISSDMSDPWEQPLIATPPQHCSAIAARVCFEKDAPPITIPEGAIMLGTTSADSKLDLMSRRSFSGSDSKKSMLDMTPYYDPAFQGVKHSSVPLVAGVVSDPIPQPSRHKLDIVASAYIHGACNARCKDTDSHHFVAGDLVYIVAEGAGPNPKLYAASEKMIETEKAKTTFHIAGVLGTCLENGESGSPFVRVFVDNSFNTMLSCC